MDTNIKLLLDLSDRLWSEYIATGNEECRLDSEACIEAAEILAKEQQHGN
jgi:hypothetical protein